MGSELLFYSKGSLSGALEGQRRVVLQKVSELTKLELEKPGLVESLFEKCKISHLELSTSKIHVSQAEGEVDLRGSRRGFLLDEEDRKNVRYTCAVMHIPFEGEEVLFELQPSSYDLNPPRAEIEGGELRIYVPLIDGADVGKQQLEATKASIEKYIGWQRGDIDKFNSDLVPLIEKSVVERRSRLESGAKAIEGMGYPTEPL